MDLTWYVNTHVVFFCPSGKLAQAHVDLWYMYQITILSIFIFDVYSDYKFLEESHRKADSVQNDPMKRQRGRDYKVEHLENKRSE